MGVKMQRTLLTPRRRPQAADTRYEYCKKGNSDCFNLQPPFRLFRSSLHSSAILKFDSNGVLPSANHQLVFGVEKQEFMDAIRFQAFAIDECKIVLIQ